MNQDMIKPTEAELEILQILWANGPSSVRDVNDKLNESREVGYTTTLKIMQIMADKGLVQRNTESRTHIYQASINEETTQKQLLQRFVNATFRGSAMKMVMQALGNHDASKKDNMKPGETISVTYLRDGKEMTASTPIKSYGQTYHQNKANKNSHNQSVAVQQKNAPVQEDADQQEDSDEIITEVDMEDMTEEEAEEMKEKVGVDMPVVNNLEIEKLNIFPNPNDGIFNLTFDLPNRGQTTIRIFNGVGRLVYQNDMQQFSGKFTDRLDISNRAKGIYFLEVTQDGKSITKKVIFQ